MELQIQNQYKDRFLAGFCNAGTPFSGRFEVKGKQITNPLLLKAKSILKDEEISFWNDDFLESFCYLGGGFLGLTMVPIDALLTGVFTMRETLHKL